MSWPKREVEMMRCAFCGKEKPWQDGFPNHTSAECWKCAWAAHERTAHPKPKPKRRWRLVPVDNRGRPL